jgi:DNA-directed RNA polymerase specialized sigma24 family protein
LRHFAGLDYRGIAAALDIEVGTVSATLSAAHQALRRVMREEEVQR